MPTYKITSADGKRCIEIEGWPVKADLPSELFVHRSFQHPEIWLVASVRCGGNFNDCQGCSQEEAIANTLAFIEKIGSWNVVERINSFPHVDTLPVVTREDFVYPGNTN